MNSKVPRTKASEIRVSNALNRASQRLNLSEKRLISLVLKAIDRPLKNDEVFSATVKADDLMQLSGITKAAAYTELKNAEKSLWLKSIAWNWQDVEDTSQVNKSKRAWIIGVDYLSGALVIYLNPLLNKHVSHLKERFTVYDLEQVGHFKSINTWRLYELLRQERTRGLLLIGLDAFRLAMDIEPDKYKQFYDLEKRVIKPALDEIEKKNGLKVSFEKLKDGKTIKTLKFSFRTEKAEQPKQEAKPVPKPSTKASKPDDNALKNEAFSQFLGYQQRAKFLGETVEQLATEKELERFREYGFLK